MLAAVALVSLVAVVMLGAEPPTPSASRAPGRTPSPTVERPRLPDAVTYRGFQYDAAVVESPTASKSQSKLWYAHGAWWGMLHEPESDELHIYRLEPARSRWVDTGTLVDERPSARADALSVGDQLYVASAGARDRAADAVRVTRFTFRDGLYRLDPDFPIRLTETGMESVVLARDGTDRLWIAFTLGQRLWVRASDGDDHHWSPAFTPSVEGTAVAKDDIASVVSFGDSVGLMWSNQNEDRVLFSVHRDADPIDAWSPAETVSRGEKQPDDHINIKADADGRVYAALKTSLEELPNANPLAPQIVLAVRDREGIWRENVVARLKDRHTRPIVLIDEQRREVYVIATAPSRGGSIYYKRSSLDDVSFETGSGSLLIGNAEDQRISNASSTKQSLTFESGLLVLASDNSTARYLHGVLKTGESVPKPSLPPVPAVRPEVLVNDTFDSWRDRERLPAGWSGRALDEGSAIVRIRGSRGGVAQVMAISDGPAPRVCRRYSEIKAGHARITFDVRSRGTGRSEPVLALVRGDGGDAAEVRFDSRGTFSYFDGSRAVVSPARWLPDTWYAVTLDIDLAARTMALAIDDDGGAALLRRADVAFPARTTSVDEICFRGAAGPRRPSLELDDLVVVRTPPG